MGIATVKGLALALGLPVAAVPTLDALARNLPFADAPVCPLLDARKGEVYLSLYRWRGDRMERQWDYLALSPRDGGRAADAAGHRARGRRAGVSAVSGSSGRGASGGARLSRGALGRRGRTARTRHARRPGTRRAGESLEPLYLRPSEAELKARRA